MMMIQMWPNSSRVSVCESNQKLEKNAGTNLSSRNREVSSRYKSPTPRRYPSPNTPRTVTKTPVPISTRAVSTERRKPATPQSPSRPFTPVHDTSVDTELAARKVAGSKVPESLWPTRMRSLNVAFQSDTYSLSTSKREKPPPQAFSDRTLKSSSNVSQKRNATPPRKDTLERKMSPLKGKSAHDQSENRLPSPKVLMKNHDLPDKPNKPFIAPNRNVGASTLRRIHLEKSASDPVRLLPSLVRKLEYDNLQRMSNLVSSSLSARSQSLPATGAQPPSPYKPSSLGSKRPVSPAPSRGTSPSQVRPSSPLRQPCNSDRVSVLTFVADIKKGKKVSDQIEDAHYLRLLYNRQSQWRFVNASVEAALKSQEVAAKKSLFNVWRSSSEIRDSVSAKRIELDQLRLKLKFNSALNKQMTYLNEWASIERENTLALSGAIEDLQSSTLRLPVTEGAMVHVETLKASFRSAIQVMQTIGSSLQSTMSRLEGPYFLSSELAIVVAQERALLDECEALMVSVASLQEKEYSLRTHLVQLKQETTLP
uniref:AUGMIN subunit 8-like n=1 Tax=Erigeron canadensis TaxID=72917 RepID=UPI001CB96D04|nr:AUGMIN subunit 8-like [Erigeron canadensis]XP_043625313.1 AUGMIN subunit 8-like [Erigeron canadensis]